MDTRGWVGVHVIGSMGAGRYVEALFRSCMLCLSLRTMLLSPSLGLQATTHVTSPAWLTWLAARSPVPQASAPRCGRDAHLRLR